MTETERVTGAGPDPTVVIFLWLLLPALWVVAHGSKLISWLLAMFRKDDVEATLAQMRSEGEIVVDHDKIFLIKEEIN